MEPHGGHPVWRSLQNSKRGGSDSPVPTREHARDGDLKTALVGGLVFDTIHKKKLGDLK
jgi:hypothetical protein